MKWNFLLEKTLLTGFPVIEHMSYMVMLHCSEIVTNIFDVQDLKAIFQGQRTSKGTCSFFLFKKKVPWFKL